jgi:hypothetical protein
MGLITPFLKWQFTAATAWLSARSFGFALGVSPLMVVMSMTAIYHL